MEKSLLSPVMGHESAMDIAYEQAEIALGIAEVPVGCAVVHNGHAIARAHNRTNIDHDPLSHAELLAVRELVAAGRPLDGAVFYITVEPCAMCHGVLERVGATVYFGCYNEIFGCRKLTGQEAGTCLEDSRSVEILRRFYQRENMFAPEEKRSVKRAR